MDHSYEEIRACALGILAGRETWLANRPEQYNVLRGQVAEVFDRRESINRERSELSISDSEIFREVFWDLFRQGITTLGLNDSNQEYPFFRLSSFGKKVVEQQDAYFFHDVSSYEQLILDQIPSIDPITLIYLKEAVQAYFSGCLLSATVMVGVSTEHSFLKLLEAIENNSAHQHTYRNVFNERTLLRKFNKFKNILDANVASLSPDVKEDLDTNLSGILSMIRNFRNESGHPTGKIVSREQCFVLIHLFIPCCKKIYQLIDHFK